MRMTEFRCEKFGPSDWARKMDYILDPKKLERVIVSNQILTPETAAIEMEAVAAANARVCKPLVHMAISWSPRDFPNHEQLRESLSVTLLSLGLFDHQWVAASHGDAQHPHIHFLANRVDPIHFKVAPLHYSIRTVQPAFRELEERYRWRRGSEFLHSAEASASVGPRRSIKPMGVVNFYTTKAEDFGCESITRSRVKAIAASLQGVLRDPNFSEKELALTLKRANVRLNVEDEEAIIVDLSRSASRASLTEWGVTGAQLRKLVPDTSPNSALSPSMFADMRVRFFREMATSAPHGVCQDSGTLSVHDDLRFEMLRKDRDDALRMVRLTSESAYRQAHLALVKLDFRNRKKALKAIVQRDRRLTEESARTSADMFDWQRWLLTRASLGDEEAAILIDGIKRRDALMPLNGRREAPVFFIWENSESLAKVRTIHAQGSTTSELMRAHPLPAPSDRSEDSGDSRMSRNGGRGANTSRVATSQKTSSLEPKFLERSEILKHVYKLQKRYDVLNPHRLEAELDIIYSAHGVDLLSFKKAGLQSPIKPFGLQITRGIEIKIASRLIVTGHNGIDIIDAIRRNSSDSSSAVTRQGPEYEKQRAYDILKAAVRWLINHVKDAQQQLSAIWINLENRAIARANQEPRLKRLETIQRVDSWVPASVLPSKAVYVPVIIRGALKEPIRYSSPPHPARCEALGSLEAGAKGEAGILLCDEAENAIYAVPSSVYQKELDDRSVDRQEQIPANVCPEGPDVKRKGYNIQASDQVLFEDGTVARKKRFHEIDKSADFGR